VIHVEVRKVMPEAITPSIRFEDEGAGARLIYRSPRRLCHLLRGLLAGTAEHFGVAIECRETTCLLEGASACTFELRFGASAEEAA
jgi:predicted hydrocarbon binding protein